MSRRPDWMSDHGPAWRSLEARRVYANPWISLDEHRACAPTGRETVYGVVRFRNLALAILPIHEDGAVTLIGQARFPAGDYSWELPEGGGPLETDPLESAKRELLEETGLSARTWIPVLEAQLSNSVTDERALGYVALDLEQQDSGSPDETELLARVRVPFHEALSAALAGHMKDMLTLAMLLRGYHLAMEGGLPRALATAMLGKAPER